MAANDLVLDMIKTHSRYDVPEDLTLLCPDVPDPDFTRGMRGSPRFADEADRPLKEADMADWPKQVARKTDAETRTCLDSWEPDGLGGDLKGQDSLGSHHSDQQEPNKHVIGKEDPDSKMTGQKYLGSHAIGREDLGSGVIGEDGVIPDTSTTVAHKYKSDGSLSDVGMNAAGRVGMEVEDDWWDGEGRPTGERWPPLGAPDDQEEDGSSYDSWYHRDRSCEGGDGGVGEAERERLRQLEEEQDQLSNSLMALTSHFAQVQFRLKQIVDASPEQKEALLTQLEEFANRGIPDIRNPSTVCLPAKGDRGEGDEEQDISTMSRQKELISQLKQQLDDLELYVYETGEGGPPQAQVMERQRVIIEQLKDRLNLNMDEMDKLTLEDLRRQVDRGVRELINPLKMKEQLVSQLQTQISDLERFIDFLQGEGGSVRGMRHPSRVSGSAPRATGGDGETRATDQRAKAEQRKQQKQQQRSEAEQLRQDTARVVDRVTTLLNMVSFGCGENGRSKFRRNTLKKTPQGSHYGDLRAALEVAIVHVEEAIRPDPSGDSEQTSDSEAEVEGGDGEGTGVGLGGARAEVTMAVRKNLTPALRDLMQHGLMPVGQSQSLVPFLSCLPHPPSHRPSKLMHAWDLILQYYHLKKGHQYNHTPARRLSQPKEVGGVASVNFPHTGTNGTVLPAMELQQPDRVRRCTPLAGSTYCLQFPSACRLGCPSISEYEGCFLRQQESQVAVVAAERMNSIITLFNFMDTYLVILLHHIFVE